MDDYGLRSNEEMFQKSTAIIHISGNQESAGRIIEVNNSLTEVFGYSRQEVIGNNIKTLMPTIIGNSHDSFLRNYFICGKNKILFKTSMLFGKDKDGFAFHLSIYIKQIPNLAGGILFVGMLRRVDEEFEYILIDRSGVIDSMSYKLSQIFQVPNSTVFEANNINIQLLAPTFLDFFFGTSREQIMKQQRYYEGDGSHVNFFIPKLFFTVFPERKKDNSHDKERLSSVGYSITTANKQGPQLNAGYMKYNIFLNKIKDKRAKQSKGSAYTSKTLLDMPEYKEPLFKIKFKCRFLDYSFITDLGREGIYIYS